MAVTRPTAQGCRGAEGREDSIECLTPGVVRVVQALSLFEEGRSPDHAVQMVRAREAFQFDRPRVAEAQIAGALGEVA